MTEFVELICGSDTALSFVMIVRLLFVMIGFETFGFVMAAIGRMRKL